MTQAPVFWWVFSTDKLYILIYVHIWLNYQMHKIHSQKIQQIYKNLKDI